MGQRRTLICILLIILRGMVLFPWALLSPRMVTGRPEDANTYSSHGEEDWSPRGNQEGEEWVEIQSFSPDQVKATERLAGPLNRRTALAWLARIAGTLDLTLADVTATATLLSDLG